MPSITEREEFWFPCDCGEEHSNKFIEGLFETENDNSREFTVALLNHNEEKHIWLAVFMNGCQGITESPCFLSAHIYLNEGTLCFSIQDAEKSPFTNVYEDNLYRISREEILAAEGLKDAIATFYQDISKVDMEIGLFLFSS